MSCDCGYCGRWKKRAIVVAVAVILPIAIGLLIGWASS